MADIERIAPTTEQPTAGDLDLPISHRAGLKLEEKMIRLKSMYNHYNQSYFRIASSSASISTSKEKASPKERSASELGGKSSISSSPDFEFGVSVDVGGEVLEDIEDRSLGGTLLREDVVVEGVDGGCEFGSSGGLNVFCFVGSEGLGPAPGVDALCVAEGNVCVRRMPKVDCRGALPGIRPCESGNEPEFCLLS